MTTLSSTIEKTKKRLSSAALLLTCFLFNPPATAGAVYAKGADKKQSAAEADTGSLPQRSTKQRMEDCIAIWEPRTHMTKQQWRRACKTLLIDPP